MRQRLTENFNSAWSSTPHWKRLPLTESTVRLSENETKAVYAGYVVPVWKLDEKNLNGRTYSRKLAEQVCKAPKITLALANHPEEEDKASVHDIMGVGKDPFIEDGFMKVKCYIVDEDFKKKVDRLVELGTGIGLSSTAFGDVDSDGNVLTEGFEVERYFDFVVAPSYQVYLDGDSAPVQESVEVVSKNETIVEKVEPVLAKEEEKVVMETPKPVEPISESARRAIQSSLVMNIRSCLKEVDQAKSVKEKQTLLESVADFVADVENADLKKQYSEKVEAVKAEYDLLLEKGAKVPEIELALREKEEANSKLSTKVDLARQMRTSFSEKLKAHREALKAEKEKTSKLTEKLTKALELLDRTKEYSNKMKEVALAHEAEKNAKVSADDYMELLRYAESLEKKLKKAVKGEPVKEAADQTLLMPGGAEMEAAGMEGEDIGYGFGKDEFGLDIWNEGAVKEYYKDLLTEDSRYAILEKEIMRCKTVVEAQMTVLRLKDLVESTASSNAIGRQMRQTESRSLRDLAPNPFKERKETSTGLDAQRIRRSGWD